MIPSSWRKKMTTASAAVGLALVFTAPGWTEDKKDAATVIAEGKQVSLEYTLTLEDKTKVDSNVGKAPLVYTQGSHDIIPGLEKQLGGLKVGESKRIEVSPEEGYGPVDPSRKQEVPKDKIPEDARKVGAKLTGRSPNGQLMFAQVTEIKDNIVVLDLNHPLAGKKLIFEVKVLKVENPPEKTVEMPATSSEEAAPKPAK